MSVTNHTRDAMDTLHFSLSLETQIFSPVVVKIVLKHGTSINCCRAESLPGGRSPGAGGRFAIPSGGLGIPPCARTLERGSARSVTRDLCFVTSSSWAVALSPSCPSLPAAGARRAAPGGIRSFSWRTVGGWGVGGWGDGMVGAGDAGGTAEPCSGTAEASARRTERAWGTCCLRLVPVLAKEGI